MSLLVLENELSILRRGRYDFGLFMYVPIAQCRRVRLDISDNSMEKRIQ